MIVSKLKKYDGKRGWLSRIVFPGAMIQSFTFNRESQNHYKDDVNIFINEYLRPRTLWLIENEVKCRVRYFLDQGKEDCGDSYESVKLITEFRNPKMITLYKLRWG